MGTKIALLKNFGSSTVIQVSNIVIKFVQVPLLISFLGVEQYGQWLVLYSFPMMFAMADFGFGSVAANDISLNIAANNINQAKIVHSTAFASLITITLVGLLGLLFIAPFINWVNYFGMNSNRQDELVLAVIFLGASVFISLPVAVWTGRFRAAEKAHLGTLMSGIKQWVSFLFLIIALFFTTRFDFLALGALIGSITYFVLFSTISKYYYPELKFQFNFIKKDYIKPLLVQGMSFQTLALANALQNQGMLIIIQGTLGAVQVAVFSTIRTVINTCIQAMGMINQVTWPEFSILIGKGDFKKAARLHHLASLANYTISIVGFFVLLLIGPILIKFWTKGEIIIDRHALFYFVIVIPLVGSYATSAVVLAACNRIKKQALLFLLGTLLNLILCWFLSKYLGIIGAGLSMTVVYIISFYHVFYTAIEITEDTPRNFITSVLNETKNFFTLILKKINLTINK